MYIKQLMKNDAINLKQSNEDYMEQLGERKWRG